MSNIFWLTEAQMVRLRPFFPKSRGRQRVDDRRVLSGIIFINRNGLRWCDAPEALWSNQDLVQRMEALERYGCICADYDWVGSSNSG